LYLCRASVEQAGEWLSSVANGGDDAQSEVFRAPAAVCAYGVAVAGCSRFQVLG